MAGWVEFEFRGDLARVRITRAIAAPALAPTVAAAPMATAFEPLGVKFAAAGVTLWAEVLAQHFHGRRTIRLWTENGDDLDRVVDAIGHMPLPPYIARAADGSSSGKS